MEKIKLHIDEKKYYSKPTGSEFAGIKARLQKEKAPVNVTLQQLMMKISNGYSVSPAVMRGTSSKDWIEQQLFMVDIDNNIDTILTVENAIKICKENDLPVAFYYYTFSNTATKPKFRLGFIMDEPVTSQDKRHTVVKVLNSLFQQSDNSCINADRIFLGTNSKALIVDENARITMDSIYNGFIHPNTENSYKEENSHENGVETELNHLKENFDFFGYLKDRNGECRRIEKGYVFKNCEICGHHDDLVYYSDTNTFYCFSSSGEVGGSIIDYLMAVENLSLYEAIDKFKYDLCKLERKTDKWEIPIKLRADLALPQLPSDCLPKRIQDYVNAVASNTSTCIDMASVCSLAILSTALQGKFIIEGKSGYTEPLNLYVLIIAKSGERKSAVVKAMTYPIYNFEKCCGQALL